MVIFKAKDYAKVSRKRAANWRKNASKASIKLADMLKNEIKLRAPKKSGKLFSSIRRIKNRVVVSGVDSQTGFAYIHWVNQTPGYRVLRYPKGAWIPPHKSYNRKWTRILPPGSSAVYGSTPSSWHWTGQSRFVTKSIESVRKKARKLVLKTWRDSIEMHVTG